MASLNRTFTNEGGTTEDGGSADTFKNIIDGIETVLQAIPFLGGLFKGSTPHIDYNTAVDKSNEIATRWITLFVKLDDEGKNLMYEKAKAYYEGYVLANFGSWWDGVIQTDYNSWEGKGWLYDKATSTYHYLGQPVFYFLRFEDSSRVESTFANRYTNIIASTMVNPIAAYILKRYGKTIGEFNPPPETGGSSGSDTSSDTQKTWTYVGVIVAGIAAAIFFMRKKGR